MSQGRDWIFVLDISGSMHGKFTSLTEGIREGLGKLNPNDRFRIVLFNNQAHSFTKGFLPADQQTITETLKRLDQVQPGNGTNLYAGLKAGIDQLDSDRAAAMVLVTDGVANVGNTQKKQFLKLLENRDLRLFTFIMGNSANRPLLEEMTRVSNGFALSISNSDDIVGQLKLAQGKMAHSSMRDIQIEVDGVRSKELVKPRLSNSLYHGQQLTLFGHYYQPGEAQVRLTGIINGEKKTYTTRFTLPEVATDHPELERLWAFAAIEELNAEMDYLGAEADTEQAIVDTAVEYGLVTDYTSMIVVRDEVFKTLNIQRTNKLRVEKEDQARQHRNTATVTEQMNRVDKQQPMFAKQSDLNQSQQRQTVTTQRYGNGGGAVSPWLVIFIAASIVLIQLGRFSPKDKTEKR
jgi:Ca-activated chloride channel family protein